MTDRAIKGIALILFGILLIFCQPTLCELLYDIGEQVMALTGIAALACGIVGLTFVFSKDKTSK